MDALSTALRDVRITGAILIDAALTAPWGYSTPPTSAFAPLLAPGSEHLALFHLVIAGHATARADEHEVTAEAGEIVVIPHGEAHELWHGATAERVDTTPLLPKLLSGDLVRERGGGGGSMTTLLCGYFGCERYAARLFLAGLPPLFKIDVRRDAAVSWLVNAIQDAVADVASGRAGRSAVLAKLAEALFLETLVHYMEDLPPGQTGWLAAARDEVAGSALACLHRDPARAWTLDDLREPQEPHAPSSATASPVSWVNLRSPTSPAGAYNSRRGGSRPATTRSSAWPSTSGTSQRRPSIAPSNATSPSTAHYRRRFRKSEPDSPDAKLTVQPPDTESGRCTPAWSRARIRFLFPAPRGEGFGDRRE